MTPRSLGRLGFCAGTGSKIQQHRPRQEFGSVKTSNTERMNAFTVKNTGASAVSGMDKPPRYLGFPASAGEPPKVLKGFEEVGPLARGPGASASVVMTLDQREIKYLERGEAGQGCSFGDVLLVYVSVGASISHIRLTGSF
ncbi:Glycoside hydrolase family 3 protein [Mycena chlorophos]|uniref:Glycoside hydrolase family 3 protein n=1 Tax=Mycena chlorophos TaxID=658473 RepID=A0A8H6WI11_MYCCL|nr:Glycoside hydrolase family 3 protein [Mycena chlorophos]